MKHEENDGNVSFQIAPMVDVVFILLLFFMASAALQEKEAQIATNLPSIGEGKPPPVILEVRVAANGNVFCGAKGLDDPPKVDSETSKDLPQLQAKITANFGTSDKGAETPIIINPDGDAKHQRVMEVLSACRKAKASNISFSN